MMKEIAITVLLIVGVLIAFGFFFGIGFGLAQ